jgi:hypothetical protein
MRLTPVGSNQTEIRRSNGETVLYSYSTPVAVFIPGHGGFCTTEKYGRTTSRHINAAILRWDCTRHDVDQGEIDRLAG